MEIYTEHVISILEASPPPWTEKKWNVNIRNFYVCDLIVVADKNLSRANWLLGKIIEIFSGSGNMIRIAKVKTSQGVYVRPTANLCLLEGVD